MKMIYFYFLSLDVFNVSLVLPETALSQIYTYTQNSTEVLTGESYTHTKMKGHCDKTV